MLCVGVVACCGFKVTISEIGNGIVLGAEIKELFVIRIINCCCSVFLENIGAVCKDLSAVRNIAARTIDDFFLSLIVDILKIAALRVNIIALGSRYAADKLAFFNIVDFLLVT